MFKALVTSAACVALAALLSVPARAQDREKKSEEKGGGRGTFDAQKFIDRHDKNKDGSLSKDELPQGMRKGFDRLDANKDGKVSKDELQQHAARMWRSVPVEVVSVWVVEAHSNPFTREDLQEAYNCLRKLDRDNDGKITEQEIREGHHEMMKARLDRLMQQYDVDGDGKISQEEADAGPLGRAFKRLDQNGDGSIDRAELEKTMTAGAKGSGQGGAEHGTKDKTQKDGRKSDRK